MTDRIQRIINTLRKTYPEAACELNYRNPFELLIATILSAQTTDQKVNAVTAGLFAQYPTPRDMLELSPEALGRIIQSIGLFRTKAKHILETCRILVDDYGGIVPSNMEDLVRLPGVGRKTASVVLANAFGIPAFPVDTHVLRLANRLGMADAKDPLHVEKQITAVVPEKFWIDLHHGLIFHGRRVCSARNPQCGVCTLYSDCLMPGSGSSSASSRLNSL